MGCCGKNRGAPPTPTRGAPLSAATVRAPRVHYFEYVGATALTALGPVTGRRYRFARHGALVPVDERDAPSMAGVPSLRRARPPE
jgi:hypothetical protein